MSAHYDAPELIYTDLDVQRGALAISTANYRSKRLGEMDAKSWPWAARAVLDELAPVIAERVLSDLVRHCFDDQDALVVWRGINIVERYVRDRLAELKKAGA